MKRALYFFSFSIRGTTAEQITQRREAKRLTMKKALIAIDLLSLYMADDSALDHAAVKVLSAASNEAFLSTHRKEQVDLIVTRLDMPGSISSEKLFEQIRRDKDLRRVSLIIICEDTQEHRERSLKCGANAIFVKPVDIDLLHVRMRQLLNVAERQAYREMLQIVDVEGKFGGRAFFGQGENISASGMLLKTQNVFKEGDQMHFTFFLLDGIRARVSGEVIRIIKQELATHAYRYGVQFTNIDPQVRSAIEVYVQKKS
jgi:DNA-binding response OmpR family regulator